MRDNIVSRAVYNAATDSEIGIIQAAKGYLKIDRSIGKIQDDKELTAKLNGLTNESAASVQDVAQSVANYANDNEDRTVEASLYSANSYQIGINVKNVDIANSGEFINISYHETTNIERHTQSEKVAGDDRTAKNRGNTAEGVWGLKNFGNADTNQISGSDWLSKNKDSKTILSGTQKAMNHLTNSMVNKNFSTWGYYVNEDKTKIVVLGATKDGDTGVYVVPESYFKGFINEYELNVNINKMDSILLSESEKLIIKNQNNKIANSILDDAFIHYDFDNNPHIKIGNIIHLDVDSTDYVNTLVNSFNLNIIGTVNESKTGGELDIKSAFSKKYGDIVKPEFLYYAIENRDKNYDGYIYNNVVISGRGLGNLIYGRNIVNIPLPNSWSLKAADMYENKKSYNSFFTGKGETIEAKKYFKLGIEEQTKLKLQNKEKINSIIHDSIKEAEQNGMPAYSLF